MHTPLRELVQIARQLPLEVQPGGSLWGAHEGAFGPMSFPGSTGGAPYGGNYSALYFNSAASAKNPEAYAWAVVGSYGSRGHVHFRPQDWPTTPTSPEPVIPRNLGYTKGGWPLDGAPSFNEAGVLWWPGKEASRIWCFDEHHSWSGPLRTLYKFSGETEQFRRNFLIGDELVSHTPKELAHGTAAAMVKVMAGMAAFSYFEAGKLDVNNTVNNSDRVNACLLSWAVVGKLDGLIESNAINEAFFAFAKNRIEFYEACEKARPDYGFSILTKSLTTKPAWPGTPYIMPLHVAWIAAQMLQLSKVLDAEGVSDWAARALIIAGRAVEFLGKSFNATRDTLAWAHDINGNLYFANESATLWAFPIINAAMPPATRAAVLNRYLFLPAAEKLNYVGYMTDLEGNYVPEVK